MTYDATLENRGQSILTENRYLVQRSADGTHRFQPFQPSSKLVEKVDQANKLKTFFFTKKNTKSDEKKPTNLIIRIRLTQEPYMALG